MLRLALMQTKRFVPSGANIPNAQRNTVRLEVRCPPEVAERAREFCKERGLTYAQLLEAGIAYYTEE